MRTRGVGPVIQGCYRPCLFEICRFLLSDNLHLPSPFSVSDPQKRDVESCSFPKSFLKSCCRLEELVPCLTLLPIHQVLMRCLLQEHASGSLSLMPSMARLPPVKPAENFDLIWSIPLAWAAQRMMLCLSAWPLLQPCAWGTLWKEWCEFELSLAGERGEFSSHILRESSDSGALAPSSRLWVHMELLGYALESDGVWDVSYPLHVY